MQLGNAKTPPNILFILTDQQRQFRHWPRGWVEENLPSFARLAQNGLTFKRAFTNTCMCSPSRATLWTSLFPAQTHVLSTGSALPSSLTTMGQVLAKAGYQVAYRGKWHLGDASGQQPSDHGFGVWDPPDAGTSLSIDSTLGAGQYNNDARYLGTVTGSQENPAGQGPSMLDFIKSVDTSTPFFLVASFVNPHDVYVAPFEFDAAGYDPSAWAGFSIQTPDTWNEDLSTKPSVQAWFQQQSTRWNVPSWTDAQRQSYAQFYAYLQTLVDQNIMTLLDAVEKAGLMENTLIFRLADHGEMALSHGLVEKAFNAYEETIRVPLIISNPQLFPQPLVTRELASHIDLLPTVASIAGVLGQYSGQFKGVDLSPLFTAPHQSLQDAIHFTFDDTAMGTPPTSRDIPSHIRALRTKHWLYAAYYTPDGKTFEYELYDLEKDKEEKINLASPTYITPDSRKQLHHLNKELIRVMAANGTTPDFPWPKHPDV